MTPRWTRVLGAIAIAAVIGAACRGPRTAVDEPDSAAAATEPPVVAAATQAAGSAAAAKPASTAPSAQTVQVVVRDFAGQPVAGARVVARKPRPKERTGWPDGEEDTPSSIRGAMPHSWDLAPRSEARTGDDGHCELAGLPPGRWSVVVDAPGRVQRGAPCTVSAGSPVAQVELFTETGHRLEGTVTTPAGAPVADALVLATYPGVAPGGRCDNVAEDFAVARADSRGRWRFDALPATIVELSCGPPGAWSSHIWPVAVPSVAALDLQIVARGPVMGVLSGEPDGKPIAGAEVVFGVETWHTARTTACATTDSDGRYRIPLYPGEGVVQISIHADGWSSRPTVVDARQPPFRLYEDRPTVLDLSLRPDRREFAAVRGVVVGPEGPVAGAKVFLTTQGGDHWSSRTVTTDASGRFHVLEAPMRRLAVVTCDAPGLYQPGTRTLFSEDGESPDAEAPWWIAADAPRPADVVVALQRGGRISGRVVDDAGRPLAGVEVVSRNGVHSKSRDDGTFVIEGLDEPSEAQVFARSADRSLEGESAKFVAGAGKDAEGIEVRMAASERANRRRRVVVTGRALPSDPAAVTSGAHAECYGAWSPVVASGQFRVEVTALATTRDVSLTVSFPGWGARDVSVPLPPGGNTADAGEVVVPRAATIRGIVDSASGPLAGVNIRLERSRDGHGIGCSLDEDQQPPIVAVTGADGGFAASGIAAGQYDITASSPGFIEEKASVSINESDSDAEQSLHLTREAFVRGRVVRRDGRTVARAEVSAERVGRDRDGYSGDDWEYDTTGGDGSFEIRVREGTSWVLEISPEPDREAFGRTDSDDTPPRDPTLLFRKLRSEPLAAGAEPATLVVDDGTSIAGRVVTAGGETVGGAHVKCTVTHEDDDSGESQEIRTDDEGRFVFSGLDPGTYDLAVEAGLDQPVVTQGVKAGRDDVEIRLAAPTTIEGTLLDEEGKAAKGRALLARSESHRDDGGGVTARTDDAGRFRFVRVGDAPCRIELLNEARAWDPTAGTWPLLGGADVAPGTRSLTLRIAGRAATTISGRVVDDDGKPFADCAIVLHVKPNATINHSCDLAGSSFEETGLAPGKDCLVEACCAGLRWQVPVPAGTTDLVVTAGADGLHRIEFGGRPHAALAVEATIVREDERYVGSDGIEARLVHATSGAVRQVPEDAREVGFEEIKIRLSDVPVGPWHVEVRRGPDGEWRRCRAGSKEGGPVLIWSK